LAGTAAFRSNQYEVAIRTWERLIQQVDPESEDGRMLQGSIEAAYTALGKPAPKAVLKVPAKGPVVSGADSDSAPQKTGVEASVRGVVELDAALKSKAAANDTVMVIARAPGSRMPVAVVRANASELPLKFTLDDSLAMSPQARISMSSQIEVEARISKTGMAQPESGDLISAVQTVKLGANGVKLQVNKVRP
jgi:cytochrome c-type biogenesis protein CcmH